MNPDLPRVYLVRHGGSAWTLTGQHTGRTDLPLTEAGERQAREHDFRNDRDSGVFLLSVRRIMPPDEKENGATCRGALVNTGAPCIPRSDQPVEQRVRLGVAQFAPHLALCEFRSLPGGSARRGASASAVSRGPRRKANDGTNRALTVW